MAAKTSWHRCRTKLRHGHPVYNNYRAYRLSHVHLADLEYTNYNAIRYRVIFPRVVWMTHYKCRGGVLISLSQAMSPQADKPLKSVTHGQCDARPTVTFPAVRHHRPLTAVTLYSLVTEAHVCEQLAQGCCQKAQRWGLNLSVACPTL